MRNKSLIVGSLSALALTLAAGVASAHVGYGLSLYDQATNTVGVTGSNGFNPTVSSNAGWISGMSNNGVNRDLLGSGIDTLADSHNNRFRFFTLDQNSTVSITVTGTANTNGASVLNPGFSIFSGLVPASSHDGAGDTNGLTPVQIAAMQTPAHNAYLGTQPAFATWSPFFDAMDEITTQGGGAVNGGEGGGANWGVYNANGNFTMGNNNGQVSTATFVGGSAVGDGHNGDTQDNSVTWTGNLGPGTYSLVIGGSNLNALQSLFNLVQQGTGNPAAGFTACDPNNPVSCSGTAFPAAYATERAARNMQISMNINGVDLQPVPVPAAVYLFGSGLIGLAGMARRKMAAKA